MAILEFAHVVGGVEGSVSEGPGPVTGPRRMKSRGQPACVVEREVGEERHPAVFDLR